MNMESDQMKIMNRYPLLVPKNLSFTSYAGYITVKGTEYKICLQVPHYPFLEQIRIDIYHNSNKINVDMVKINTNLTLFECLMQLEKYLSEQEISKDKKFNIDNYFKLIEETGCLNQYNKCKVYMNIDTNKITIKQIENFEHHYLVIQSSQNGYYDVIDHSLPSNRSQNSLFYQSRSIENIYKKLISYLNKLSTYYSDLNEVDLICWVIDPAIPGTKDNFRRIIVGENCSLLITLDPWSYGSVPSLTVMGPNRIADGIKKKIARNIRYWEEDCNLYRNLHKILELTFFPAKEEGTSATEILLTNHGECCICFIDRLNGVLPNLVCENKSCSQYFHTECLYQWLSSLTTNHERFGMIQGQCPNCCETISCNIPSRSTLQ